MFHAADPDVSGPLRELGSYTNSQLCAIPPGDANAYELDVAHTLEPGDYYFTSNSVEKCEEGSRLMISVDEE